MNFENNPPILNSFPQKKGERGCRKSGFTLVELIVVITILAILGTIAFISLQGYSRDARDSIRISDLNTMKTSLELFNLDAGKYASTTDGTIITYSGAEVWTQGYFGDNTTNSVDRLDDTPTDPLTEQEYIYSTTSTKQEFQLAGIMEGSDLGYNSISQTNAGDKIGTINITGNYNGKVLKVSTGGVDYVLVVPSIIGSLSGTLENIILNKGVAYDGYNNLPFQYDGSSYNVLGNTTETFVSNTAPGDFVLFSGNLSDLSSSEAVGITARAGLITGFETAYSGTTIENVGEIATLISTSVGGDATAIEFLASTVVSNDLGGSIFQILIIID